jgi:hypothetical protein
MNYLKPENLFAEFTEIYEELPEKEGCMFPMHPHSIYCLPVHYNTNRTDSIFNKLNVITLGAKPIFIVAPGGFIPKW